MTIDLIIRNISHILRGIIFCQRTPRRSYRPILWLMLAASVSLSGCGSSGGGNAPAAVAPVARSMPTNIIRTSLNGDHLQYSLSGIVNTTSLSGTATSTITLNASPLDPNGKKQTLETTTINATLANGTPVTSTTNSYTSQDATGTIFEHGDSTSGWVTIPNSGMITSMVSPIVSPYTWVRTATFQNGDTTTATISVGGPVAVTTPLGTFDSYSYTMDVILNASSGSKTTGSEVAYVVPDIGLVKSNVTLTITAANGTVSTSQMNLSLSATNIAYP
ncbi:MAG: hypothetical protein R8J85_07775 [Mariprofundales bacterium]